MPAEVVEYQLGIGQHAVGEREVGIAGNR
jgi:hypothetical protein